MKTLRSEQIEVLDGLMPELYNHKIVLCEAGTGIGKSLIIAHAALKLAATQLLETARRPAIIIAAPTVHTLVHLVNEWESCAGHQDQQIGIVLGRAQFIDSDVLGQTVARMIADEDVVKTEELSGSLKRLQAWVNAGCPAGHTAATRTLQTWHPGIACLRDDFEALAQGASLPNCILSDTSKSAAQQPYKELHHKAQHASIVFCTHAMLAADSFYRCVRKQAILPDRCALFIDEAHLYEQAQASFASKSIAFHTLEFTLRATWPHAASAKAAQAAWTAAKAAILSLQKIPNPGKDFILPRRLTHYSDIDLWRDIENRLGHLAAALRKLIGSLCNERLIDSQMAETLSYLDEVQDTLTRLQLDDERAKSFISISLSPIRKWPSLNIGPRSVHYLLNQLWESADCAALLSATLSIPNAQGAPDAGYMSRILQIPKQRAAMTKPVHPAWIFETPVLVHPEKTDRCLIPPSGSSEHPELLNPWIATISEVILQIIESSAGGTLILMSGYERAQRLYDAMIKATHGSVEVSQRLMLQQRQHGSVSHSVETFQAMHRAGLKPIWIATGQAWTGLDIRDRSIADAAAAQDTLLSDLIIPNLPINMNRTSTHQERVDYAERTRGQGQFEESHHTALMFRQGLGRLVRRSGLQQRRIFVLDPRYLLKPLHQTIGHILAQYPRQASLSSLIRLPDTRPSQVA